MPKILEHWESYAAKKLVGRKIVKVRYLTQEEVEDMGWDESAVVLQLDDGSLLFPSQDDEGNGAGAMFGQDAKGEDLTLPVISTFLFDQEMSNAGT